MTAVTRPNAKRAARVLVVDDDHSLAETLAEGLIERGYDAIPLASSRDALLALERDSIDVLVTDLRMPHVDGLGLLAASRRSDEGRPVIVMTAYSAVDTAIESIRKGAYHYLTKPFKVVELVLFLERALGESALRREAIALRRALKDSHGLDNIVGTSAAMHDVKDLVLRVADASAPVLVTGETGTGKGLVARAIHANGRRSKALFVAVNCASLPENLLESELFGHARGAFTGATSHRTGLFEEADGGTLFLDEIGEMAPGLQAKLLHVLESGAIRPVGGNKERPVDVRIITATHRDLRKGVATGTFREDLLYRLDVVTIALPPLRQRPDDLPALVDRFLASAKSRNPRSPVETVTPEAYVRLLDYAWPGNVRELEHVIERAVLVGTRAGLGVEDLPPHVRERAPADGIDFVGQVLPMRELQRRYAAWARGQLGGGGLQTAAKLGVDFKTLQELLGDEAK